MFGFKAALGLGMMVVLASPALGRADDRASKITGLVEQGWGLIAQHKNQEAIPPLEQALAITGDPAPPSPETAYVMKALGTAYANTGKFEQAETYGKRVVAIEAAVFGPDDIKDIEGVANLGITYAREQKFEEARPYFEKALSIAQAKLPADSPQLAYCLAMLGQFDLQTGKKAEGQALLARANAISPVHP